MENISAVATRAYLLSIGDELLLGEIVDTNAPYIARELLSLGITVAGASTVPDELDDIVAAFQRALTQADLVIATGGLGPTDDDLTLEAVGRALGVPLEHHEEVMEQMAARLNRPIGTLSPSNRKQAQLPRGANILKNDWGTAPGVHCVTPAGKDIFLMPGVPREMKGLLGERVLPLLRQTRPARQFLAIKKIHCFGVGESVLGERIKPFMQQGLNPNVGTRVAGGVVTVRLVAHGSSRQEAEAVLAPCADKIRGLLQAEIFGEDEATLGGAAVSALAARNKTVALAESCTAGWVASLLAEIPGASAVLIEGVVAYANETKVRRCGVKPETLAEHGAVSAQVAAEMAEGLRARAGTDIALSVTGIAGPSGGTESKPVGVVWFGLATAAGGQTLERRYPGLDRNTVRQRAAMQALDLLRRAALS
jgi:nicotinamide-nucleotide amidase